MSHNLYRLLLWMLLVMNSSTVFCAVPQEFQEGWKDAEQFVREHRKEWKKTFKQFGVDYRLAEAVAFPEMVRYSKWKDRLETAANNALYIRGGYEKANFSIGHFQMRPSFAENVEKEWNASPLAEEFGFSFITLDNPDARRSRISRLTTIEGQARYLAIYLRLQYLRHPWLLKEKKEYQVRYLATAYNSRYDYSREKVVQNMHTPTFHNDMLRTVFTRLYQYCDLAWEYYSASHK